MASDDGMATSFDNDYECGLDSHKSLCGWLNLAGESPKTCTC